jgi:hypothetical protein
VWGDSPRPLVFAAGVGLLVGGRKSVMALFNGNGK